MTPSNVTPMIKQYLSIKDEYPDALLFYRMGDFYEMFFEDAELASRLLEITLTSRNKKDKTPIPMCGVPFRAVKGYIARLIGLGYKVAICDQIEDPALAKGLVKRDVVRVITPGMIVEDEFLDAKSNNYVLALIHQNQVWGLAFLDISTAEFLVTESSDVQAIVDETLRVGPKELLLPESAPSDPIYAPVVKALADLALSFLNNKLFENNGGRARLLEQFKTRSLEGFGCEHFGPGIGAAGALLSYVNETQKQPITHLSRLQPYELAKYLLVDDLSCRNLELLKSIRTGSTQGSLFGIIDRTATPMGGRMLKRWLRYPLIDAAQINARLDAVAEARARMSAARQITEQLKKVYDMERLGSKVAMGQCNARDLVALKRSLQTLPAIAHLLAEFESRLCRWHVDLSRLNDLGELIERSIREDAPPTVNEGGIIKKGFNSELDELIRISRDGKGWLAELEVREKSATGINALKVRYNKVFGYYIEIPKSRSEVVPTHYVRKQTLVNAERYITDELKTFESKVLGAEEQRARLEYEIFSQIRQEIVANNSEIQAAAVFLARIDCLLNLAIIAEQNDYTRPRINLDGRILIEDGRHPVVEKMIRGERFVPNTIEMDNENNQILIITGPNMAGKSTILRQVALLVLMAQMGSFVPARNASVALVDRIFTRVGALDNLSQGQSTFMVEMEETANILNNATSNSLVIMDEIGRGTSTFDGLSIAWAVAEYLHDTNMMTGVKTLFATHYHELTELARKKARIKNFNIAVKEWNDEIIFLRKLVPGGTNRSYGIQVARLAGIPDAVIARSKKILFRIENNSQGSDRAALIGEEGKNNQQRQKQLNLFRNPEQFIIDRLQKLDLGRMTPIEALNCLHELQEKIKSIPE
jgi:DNA mismatch repair protein MutS